ncbi:hypothetical protein HYS91_05980 [Candidatus Daviesbacteria bacterium]|nr:hypothetical protein [Candidatus Daviesbacteria bacterium]
MESKTFSKSEAIKFGWKGAKSNLGFFIPALLVSGLISFAPTIIGSLLNPPGATNTDFGTSMFLLFISIAGGIIRAGVDLGFIKIGLKFVDGEKPQFSELFSQFSKLLKYIGSGLLLGLINILVLLPFILVVGFLIFSGIQSGSPNWPLIILVAIASLIPLVILGIRFQFFSYFIVDGNFGPIQALKQSWGLTKEVTINLFLLNLVLGLINFLGILALFIGLFITAPLTMLASAYVFRKLQSQAPT